MTLMIITSVVILLIALVPISLSFACYMGAFRNNGKKKDQTFNVLTGDGYDVFHDQMITAIKDSFSYKFEEVYIKSYDGLTLYGRLYRCGGKGPVIIGFHGYKGNGIRDMAAGIPTYFEQGCDVLIVDQRGHGKSGGETITFGIKERFDALSWASYVDYLYMGEKKILLFGISLGASTVVMASNLNLPKSVVGIIADCPFSSPIDIVLKVTKEKKLSPKFFCPFFILGAMTFGKFSIIETTAADSVKKSKIPVLLIHGTEDKFVPFEMGKEIEKANPEKVKMVAIEGAAHGMSFFKDKTTYKKELNAFINKVAG